MAILSQIPVHVYSTDSITRCGLVAQVEQAPELRAVDEGAVNEDSVVILAAELIDDPTVAMMREFGHRGCPHFILVTSSFDENTLRAAVNVGMSGMVNRSEVTAAKLAQVAVQAKRGEATVPADMLNLLLRQLSDIEHNVVSPHLLFSRLTEREASVLRLVADGLDTDEIGATLAYSPRTVKNILHGITTRYCLRNRSHAVAYAMREGLI